MKTKNGAIVLDDYVGFSPSVYGVNYTDTTGVVVHIPMKVLVGLHDGAKFHLQNNGIDWEYFCNSLFK